MPYFPVALVIAPPEFRFVDVIMFIGVELRQHNANSDLVAFQHLKGPSECALALGMRDGTRRISNYSAVLPGGFVAGGFAGS